MVIPSPLPVPPAAASTALLPPDVGVDGPWRHAEARAVWLGMVWGRLGRGDLAAAWFDQVHAPVLQPWIGAERGRLLRELGHHVEAEAVELPALLQAEDPVDAAMLRVSLTADAVGLGDLTTATSRLQAARAAVAQLPDGPRAARQRLRLGWVEVEVAWLRGEAPPVDQLPHWSEGFGGPRFPPDHAAGSVFHSAKGLLFGGVARRDLRLLEQAVRQAPPALLWAVHAARAAAGVVEAQRTSDEARAEVVALPSPQPTAPPEPS